MCIIGEFYVFCEDLLSANVLFVAPAVQHRQLSTIHIHAFDTNLHLTEAFEKRARCEDGVSSNLQIDAERT
jgi:hypothetical protein